MTHEDYLKLAIEEALEGLRAGDGGPFGAVIVNKDQVIGKGHNRVLQSHDPTAHAEIIAIRNACMKTGSHHLTGSTIYSNFEPCPMCLAAIYWADIRSLFYCADRNIAREIGFMDSHLYNEFRLPEDKREVISTRIELKEMEQLMGDWDRLEGKILY
jgi:guanine deaminase